MTQYCKPNVHLPVSLHDARVTALEITRKEEKIKEGVLAWIFQEGYTLVQEEGAIVTGPARIFMKGVDWEFSQVVYEKGDMLLKPSFLEFQRDIEEFGFDIIDETYGYNRSVFQGGFFQKETWISVQVEVYHFHETLYEWSA